MAMVTFGSYLRRARYKANFGQRELARIVGLSASYFNDIEHDKRPAPKEEVLNLLKEHLEIKEDKFFDLAGKSKKRIPPDVEKFLLTDGSVIDLIRMLQNLKFSKTQTTELKNMVASQNYKAIIIAAGLGSRLKDLTKAVPKCMLELNGKSILQRQLDAYKKNGIKDISVVRGYQRDKINLKNLKYYENTDYKNNNILNSLFYAEKEIEGNVIISYSDIVFSHKIVERLLASNADISIVVDVDWRGRYEIRQDHPIAEAENVIFDANHNVIDIGKIITSPGDVHGEFIGMMKLSPRGAEIFKRHFHRSKKLYWDKQFQRASTFQKAYLTDILKDMIELGVPVFSVIIEQGWQEIDTVEDLNNAISKLKEQGLST